MNRRIKRPKRETRKRFKKEKWEDVRPTLYKLFSDAGIQSCELRYDGCKGGAFKSFAHSLRRVKIATYEGREHAEKMREVIWACTSCHKILDAMEPEVTYDIVRYIIKKREKPIKHEYNI